MWIGASLSSTSNGHCDVYSCLWGLPLQMFPKQLGCLGLSPGCRLSQTELDVRSPGHICYLKGDDQEAVRTCSLNFTAAVWSVQITLAYEHQNNVSCSVKLHLLDPVAHRVEGRVPCDVVGDHGTVSTAVVALSDGAKPLLAGRVPHLDLCHTRQSC